MSAYDKARIKVLAKAVQRQQESVESLSEANARLLVRQTLLTLLRRVIAEVMAHKERFDADVLEERWQLAGLREVGGDGGGAAAAVEEFLRDLPHLAPEASLLGLERVAAPDVDAARSKSFPQLAADMATLVAACRGTLAPPQRQQQAGTGPGAAAAEAPAGPAEVAEAAACLAAAGRAMSDLIVLFAIWNPEVYLEGAYKNFTSGVVSSGDTEAPSEHWDGVVTACAFSREQVLLFIDNYDLMMARLRKVWAQRAQLVAELQELEAGAAAAGARGAPCATPGAGAAFITQEELAEELAVNSRCERAVFLMHSKVDCALMLGAEWARTWAAAFPFPLNHHKIVEVSRQRLRAHASAFPPARERRCGAAGGVHRG